MKSRRIVPLGLLLYASIAFMIKTPQLGAIESIELIDGNKPQGGWTFDNGREFPGAVGKLELTREDNQPTLKLHGDFSRGGMYVQAARRLDKVAIDSVAFDIKVPRGVGTVTTRLIDGTGQCHQLKIRLNDKGGWQRYTFPVARYFASLEQGAPMDIVTNYEKWSGANDGRWHQPAKLFVILAGKEAMSEGHIALRNVELLPTPPKVNILTTLRLDDVTPNDLGPWQYNNGNEFKGAEGDLTVDSGPEGNHPTLTLAANFTDGGRYVGARRKLPVAEIKHTNAIHLKTRSENVNQFSLRLVDETGQCHQRHGIKITADGKWHDLTLDPNKIAGGEHWGGANDGRWHGAAKLIEIMLNPRSSEKSAMKLQLADIRSDVVVPAQLSRQTWTAQLNSGEQSLDGWQTQGDVSVAEGQSDQGHALRLARSLQQRNQPTTAISPPFAASQGTWRVRYGQRSQLHSPDNSYHAAAAIDAFDRDGQQLESIPLGILFGDQKFAEFEKLITLPEGTANARLRFSLQKAHGEVRYVDLSATRLEVQPIQPGVESIRIASGVLGNLFYPADEIEFQLTVPTSKVLGKAERVIRYRVRDYRGTDVLPSEEVSLKATPEKKGREYQATIQLPKERLNIGQFYELHVEVPQGAAAPVREFSGFAILPKAATKAFAPEEIPFTIRNWDNRINAYFQLSDRLGLRNIGLWGGWSPKPPYKPHLPGIEAVKELDAAWLTTTPASKVEDEGFKTYTEESLRRGMTNFLSQYADQRLAAIAQGNEPHGTGQAVLDNVAAYRANYEAVKAVDKQIHVIGTSVEPNEEYFKAGYQNYLDSYDFHIYEHYSKVRKTMQQYRALMEKYNAVKPIHSTELGLNSQGQSRRTVAIEMIKKCTVFFAEGGATVGWFTIMYPDPKGNARGQFGDSHCMFDCKYNNYNPRLDAITYYHLINSLTDKRFVSEEQRDDQTQVFLFRNQQNECLQIVWNDDQEKPVDIALPAGTKVEALRLDGQRKQLTCAGGALKVNVSAEPLLLRYTTQQ